MVAEQETNLADIVLEDLDRKELQTLAKQHKVPASQSSRAIIRDLTKLQKAAKATATKPKKQKKNTEAPGGDLTEAEVANITLSHIIC